MLSGSSPFSSATQPTSLEWAALDSLLISPNRQFLNRDDIGIILINQYIAEMVRHALDAHQRSIPAVLEIDLWKVVLFFVIFYNVLLTISQKEVV